MKTPSEMSDGEIKVFLESAENLRDKYRPLTHREAMQYYDVREEARKRGLRPPAPPVP